MQDALSLTKKSPLRPVNVEAREFERASLQLQCGLKLIASIYIKTFCLT